MAHPHEKAIENMSASSLIRIIQESKMIYVRENLSRPLHESQIRLLKQVKRHEKPHHKQIRIKQYEKAEKNEWFKTHLDLYLQNYRKLAKKGLIVIDENPVNGLPYDCSLTEEGSAVLTEIYLLETKWERIVGMDKKDLEALRKMALDSYEISYKHKKKRGFIF